MLIIRNPLLESFEATARLGTVHAAAKELKVTQTAITQRLKALELGLSMTLFLRSRRGMSLTQEGKALLMYSKRTRELEGLFLSHATGKNRSEIALKVVGPTSAISTRIAENLEPIYSMFPFIRLHLQSDDHSNLIEMIRRGDADLAVLPPNLVPNEMDSKVLKPDRYLLVASSKWKGRSIADILEKERIIDFHDRDETTSGYLKSFSLKSNPNNSRLFINENDALIRMIAAGVGYGTLTESVAEPALSEGKLIILNRGQPLNDPLALAWYPRPQGTDYFEAIVRAIK